MIAVANWRLLCHARQNLLRILPLVHTRLELAWFLLLNYNALVQLVCLILEGLVERLE